jgi:DnaJ family protein C protein 1
MEVNYQEHEKEASQEDSEEDSDTASGDSKSDSEYDGGYSVATKDEFIPTEVKSKVKTKGGKQQLFSEEQPSEATGAVVIEEHWSLQQQKALEAALVQFPKGATERWERIANKVPVKTKDQCILRFKTLAEMVKKKKEEASNIATTTASVS